MLIVDGRNGVSPVLLLAEILLAPVLLLAEIFGVSIGEVYSKQRKYVATAPLLPNPCRPPTPPSPRAKSQTMRIASAQRLMAWPGVCRELLSEKEQDSSSPIGLWDQPGRRPFSNPPPSAPSNPESNSSPSNGTGSGGASDGGGGGELSAREARLSPAQREAVRLLFGNLAAPPAVTRHLRRQRRSFGVEGEAAAAEVDQGPSSDFPHHHHTVAGPHVPYALRTMELPSRESSRHREFPAAGGGGAGGGGGGGGGAAAGAAGAAGGGAGAGRGGGEGGGGGGGPSWYSGRVGTHHHNHGGGATLENAQPACSHGGLCWPTLYDLTLAKRRQRERLRSCFRKFSRGQKLDVRDQEGVWMGAEVIWAPGGGNTVVHSVEWDDAADAAAAAAPGIGVATMNGAGGGVGGGGGGGAGVPPPPTQGYGGRDRFTPEWRRLLQLGLMADGGHLGIHQNNNNGDNNNNNNPGAAAGAAAAAAAAAANGVGSDSSTTAAVVNGVGGDWVTTGAVDVAQSFLASAVASAADSVACLSPAPRAAAAAATAAAAAAAVATPASPPPSPPPMHGIPPGLASTLVANAAAAGAPPGAMAGLQAGQAAGAVQPAAAGAGNGAPAAVQVFSHGQGGGGGGNAFVHGGRKSVLIHYEGHKSKYDEWISVQSPRLAPFRSRTTRPLSVTMQSVERVVNGASVGCVGFPYEKDLRASQEEMAYMPLLETAGRFRLIASARLAHAGDYVPACVPLRLLEESFFFLLFVASPHGLVAAYLAYNDVKTVRSRPVRSVRGFPEQRQQAAALFRPSSMKSHRFFPVMPCTSCHPHPPPAPAAASLVLSMRACVRKGVRARSQHRTVLRSPCRAPGYHTARGAGLSRTAFQGRPSSAPSWRISATWQVRVAILLPPIVCVQPCALPHALLFSSGRRIW